MTKIRLSGRRSERSINDLFEKSNLFRKKELSHHPFLVFLEEGDVITEKVVNNAMTLLQFPDETQALAQWPGMYESHWFQFNVGQWRQYYEDHQPWEMSD